ncbi:MAG: hypothetical protein ABIN01_14640, partial [Ferruginibacter sp.]
LAKVINEHFNLIIYLFSLSFIQFFLKKLQPPSGLLAAAPVVGVPHRTQPLAYTSESSKVVPFRRRASALCFIVLNRGYWDHLRITHVIKAPVVVFGDTGHGSKKGFLLQGLMQCIPPSRFPPTFSFLSKQKHLELL